MDVPMGDGAGPLPGVDEPAQVEAPMPRLRRYVAENELKLAQIEAQLEDAEVALLGAGPAARGDPAWQVISEVVGNLRAILPRLPAAPDEEGEAPVEGAAEIANLHAVAEREAAARAPDAAALAGGAGGGAAGGPPPAGGVGGGAAGGPPPDGGAAAPDDGSFPPSLDFVLGNADWFGTHYVETAKALALQRFCDATAADVRDNVDALPEEQRRGSWAFLAPVPSPAADEGAWIGWLMAILCNYYAMLFVVAQLPEPLRYLARHIMTTSLGASQVVTGTCEMTAAECDQAPPADMYGARNDVHNGGNYEPAHVRTCGNGTIYPVLRAPAGFAFVPHAAPHVYAAGADGRAFLDTIRNRRRVPVVRVSFAPVFLALVLLRIGSPNFALVFFKIGIRRVGQGLAPLVVKYALVRLPCIEGVPAASAPTLARRSQGGGAYGLYGGDWAVVLLGSLRQVCLVLVIWCAVCAYVGAPVIVSAHPFMGTGLAVIRVMVSAFLRVHIRGQ